MRLLSTVSVIAILGSTSSLTAQDAFSSQSWTMCTTGGYRSCGTFALATDARRTGAVRTGTAVSVSVTNLQGSLPAFDNTLWSIFPSFILLGHFPGMMGTTSAQPLTPVLPGQFPEPDSWAWQSGTVLDVDDVPLSFLQVYSPSYHSTIAGCDTVDPALGPSSPSIYTCTAAQFVTMSFDMPSIFDADQFEVARFETQGVTDPAADDISGTQCNSDPAAVSEAPGEAACRVLAHTVVHPGGQHGVVPEPATLALMMTGFAALGLVSRRRRS